MTQFDWATLALGFLSVIAIPITILMLRGAIKWTKTEMKLDALIEEVKELVDDKEKVHNEIFAQMREDRKATDARLRWLETHLWRRGERD